jgi:predicted ATPase/transcriptional regulator with XRE-family HTH domain
MEEVQTSGSSAFGTLLREYRLAAGLSQEALAERARMSSHGVSALERGYRRTPQRETLSLLVGALGLDDEQRRAFERAAARTGLVRRGVVAAATPPWPSSPAATLPFALTSFVGRETELREITALVREHRLVTITGTGGVGKTQMALQVGSALGEATEGAVCFAGLAPVANPSFVVSAIASALGTQPAPNQPPLQALLAYLQNRQLLLILDNCEHVVGEAATIANTLLGKCAQLRILATSREPLKVSGEYTYRLPSLTLPAAVSLFFDRARAVDHRFALNENTTPVVRELGGHLDGIPLAIELAAARISLLPVKAIAEGLGDRFRILTGGERTALPRQQTMRAAIDWSYDLLNEREMQLFERLSIFSAGCTLATAAALYEGESATKYDILEWLSSLVDKSLVVADFEETESRYRLLESFREYAREKLAKRGEEQLIARRLAVAYVAVSELPARARDELDRNELDNWQAAMQWAFGERGDVLLGQRLAAGFPGGAMPLEGRRWVNLALEMVDEQTPTEVLAGLVQTRASLAFHLREYQAVVASSQEAIALHRKVGDWLNVVRSQDMAGNALISLGRVDEAKVLIEEALTTTRKMEHQRGIAWSLRCLAYANAKAGDFVTARAYFAEVLPIYESEFHQVDLAYALNDLGMYEFCAGDGNLALEHALKAYALAREYNDARCTASTLNTLSIYLLASARYDEAEARAREGLEIATEQHLEVVAAYALAHFAAIAALRPPDARDARSDACARAARILGFVDARLAALGSAQTIVQEWERAHAVKALSREIDADVLAKEMAAGSAMTQEQAVASVLTG